MIKTMGPIVILILSIFSIQAADKSRAELVQTRTGKWYDKMDFGPSLATIVQFDRHNTVLKGLAVRVGANESHTMVYDTEMMSFNGAMKGFLKISGTPWNGSHGGNPIANNVTIKSSLGPGWAKDGSFADPRKIPYGPLPKDWVKFKGHYRNGFDMVLHYSVGSTDVFEHPEYKSLNDVQAYVRNFKIADIKSPLTLMVLKGTQAKILGSKDSKKSNITVATLGSGVTLRYDAKSNLLADIKPGKGRTFSIIMSVAGDLDKAIKSWPAAKQISSLIKGGKAQWPKTFKVKATTLPGKGPYLTDDIPMPPDNNPWQSKIRFSGFDFFSDGKRAAICTWNGDVWILSGIDKGLKNLTWKRYAAGLFETLGIKIVDDIIYVTGKDQITRLHDLNKDGEADYYECFNNDIMITKNFHEFTFGLQTDKQGNFYIAKGAPVRRGGRGFEFTHDHHGVIFKISKDGSKSKVHANGLRAPGGLGVGPNGEVTTGENEGTYVPACKISWAKKGSFNGVILKHHNRTMKDGYNPPLCWLPMYIDNSGGGQVWVDPNNKSWGPFAGDLIHLSYGRSKLYKVMKQEINGVMQGGVFEIPVKLSSSAMRARFHPVDKQLYVSGFKGWQTNATKNSGFQRIRYTGKVINSPSEMKVTKKGIYITFTQKLDKELAEDITSYSIKWWNYLWSPQYGSAHFSVDNPDNKALELAMKKETKAGGTRGSSVRMPSFKGDIVKVKSVKLQADGKTVFIEIPSIKPVMQMAISLDLETADGDEIITTIYNTIHQLAD